MHQANQPAPTTVGLWSDILRQVPESRLMLLVESDLDSHAYLFSYSLSTSQIAIAWSSSRSAGARNTSRFTTESTSPSTLTRIMAGARHAMRCGRAFR